MTLTDIIRAAIDEFDGAGGVSDRDIADFLTKQGVQDVHDVKRRLLAGQSVGEAYGKDGEK